MPATETDAVSARPFRRFPWAQLVFCVACLTMAGWTWMRYSYCRDAQPFPSYVSRPNDLEGRYVTISCVCAAVALDEENPMVFVDVPGALAVQANRYFKDDPFVDYTMYISVPRGARYEEGRMAIFTGRVRVEEDSTDYPDIVAVYLDATASRFHPGSVAGIVVGAMGCFIFGLYLRRWLRARRE